jgi:site-specific recombinase XerD
MVNRNNYLQAKSYLHYVSQMKQRKDNSVSRYWSCLRHLLLWADATPLSHVAGIEPAFASYLGQQSKPLAPAAAKKIIQTVKRFLTWVKLNYPQDYRRLPAAWIEDLSPPRSVQQIKEHVFIGLDEVLQLIRHKPAPDDLAMQRDQAAAAFLFVSGMRADAFASMPLQAVELGERAVKQWPTLGVRTKNSKAATTYLLEIPELWRVIEKWDSLIRAQLPVTAMWYTSILNQWGEHILTANPAGANRNVAIAKRLRLLYAAVGLPYKSPHKFRHGHAVYALQRAQTMADYKAISMNLMHGDIRVTDSIYAPLLGNEVRQRIARLTDRSESIPPAGGDLTEFLRQLSKGQMAQALHILADEVAR